MLFNVLKKPLLCACLLLTVTFTLPALAQISTPSSTHQWSGLYFGLAGGSFGTKLGETTYLKQSPSPVPSNTYVDKRCYKRVFVGAIEIGYQYLLPHQFAVQSALGVYRTGRFKIHGDFYTFGASPADKSYAYNVRTTALIPTFRLTYTLGKFSPYIVSGAGYASNEVSGYTEHALNGGTILPGTAFASHTETNFAYMLGLGCFYHLTQNIDISLAYKYANFGSASLGGAPNQSTSARKSVGDIHANLITLGVAVHLA